MFAAHTHTNVRKNKKEDIIKTFFVIIHKTMILMRFYKHRFKYFLHTHNHAKQANN